MTSRRLFAFLGSWSILLILVFLAALSWHQFASTSRQQSVVKRSLQIETAKALQLGGLVTGARAWAIYDPATGQLMAGERVDEPLPIASITKLSTLLRTRNLPDSQQVTVTADQAVLPPAEAGFTAGEAVTVSNLRAAAAVASANDAAAALGTLASDETFALDTTFTDFTGLGDKNLASARAVAQLLDLAWRSPKLSPLLGLPEVTIARASGPAVLATTNRLHDTLRTGDVVGGKTGYTDAAGFCLAERFRRGNQEIIVVVLGSETTTRQATAAQVLSLATTALNQLVPAAQ